MFYLDYVGCKVTEEEENEINKIKFYLDYVGCKG